MIEARLAIESRLFNSAAGDGIAISPMYFFGLTSRWSNRSAIIPPASHFVL
jgi:hypothetical protein